MRVTLLWLLFLVSQFTFAQEKTISGVVSDESGGLPGVSIIIKGTTTGVETDFDGNYSINAKQNDILVFSFVGKATQVKTVGASNKINVVLADDANLLTEVVVTALGIKRKAKSIGSAQQTVKGDDLTKTRETDISTALAGKVSGIQFTGQPSSSFKGADVRLRGAKNVLYVVDGIRLNSSTDVNTEDIESMTVLKGLAATALYGPSGKNGAIVIISKKGKNGKSEIVFNSSIGLSSVMGLPEYQNQYGGGYRNDGKPKGNKDKGIADHPDRNTSSIGYWNTLNGQKIVNYAADESWGPKLDGALVRQWDSWIKGDPEFGKLRAWSANPDNIKDFYRTGQVTNNSLTFSKGGEGYSIRTTLGQVKQDLVLENSDRKTTRVNTNLSFDLNKKLTFSTTVNYSNRVTKNDPDGQYNNLASNLNQWWQRQIDVSRLKDYKRNGEMVSWNINSPTNPRPAYWNSPYFTLYENGNLETKDAVFGKVALAYKITEKLNASVAYKRAINQYERSDKVGFGGLATESFRERKTTSSEDEIFGIANYSNTWNDFELKASTGFQLIDRKYNTLDTWSVGGLTTKDFYSIGTSKDRPGINTTKFRVQERGMFLTTDLGYKELVYLTGSYRIDYGSTANADNNRLDTKGLSASFIFSELIPENNILSFGKLRAGTSQAPYFPNPFQLNPTYNAGTSYGSNGTSIAPNTAVNPNLEGGLRSENEFGIELRFLHNRISLDATYFSREDKNLPSDVSLPTSTGYYSFVSNEGKQSSNGFELAISGDIIKTDDLKWNVAINAATLKRKVDFIAKGVKTNIIDSWGPQLLEKRGEEWGAIYGNAYKRDAKGNKVLGADGLYEFENNKYLGSILPDLTGGFTSNLTYKNFDLSLGFDYQVGGKFYGVTRAYTNYSGNNIETVGNNSLGNPIRNKIIGKGTHKAYSVNLKNAAPNSGGQLTSGVDADGNAQSFLVTPAKLWKENLINIHEEFVNDATYLKLRTIRLGYNVPKSVLENSFFTDINLSVFANNVWLIHSEVKGIDPSELQGRSNGSRINGYNNYEWIENGQLPAARTIGINTKFTF
ncbi:SusC/RagA family TonB-linked outer membrane protein [Tenacibaculum finnmarkense]|nr:SusC/RagA family TonB-linked outer membrane protein [Tenacibaculum finnmarkense]